MNDKIILSKLCPALYESPEMYIEIEGWQEELGKFFGECIAENPDISLQRITLFVDALSELEKKTVEHDLWLKIIEFMVVNDIDSITATKWEIIYFLKECKPVTFQLQIARSIHRPEEEMIISNEEMEEMIKGNITYEDPENKPDPDQKGWDLDILMWFNREKIEKHENFANFPKGIKDGLDMHNDNHIDVFLLKNTTLKEIRKVLGLYNAEINDLGGQAAVLAAFFNGDAVKSGGIEIFYDVEIIVAIQISPFSPRRWGNVMRNYCDSNYASFNQKKYFEEGCMPMIGETNKNECNEVIIVFENNRYKRNIFRKPRGNRRRPFIGQ